MSEISIQPTIWSNLPDIHEVVEFSEGDKECLREIRDVLKKHGQMERFGVSLLHTHFDIADDELLLETTDVQKRTQIIRPVKIQDYQNREDLSLMTTVLKFVEGDEVAVQRCGCGRDKDGHTGDHPKDGEISV